MNKYDTKAFRYIIRLKVNQSAKTEYMKELIDMLSYNERMQIIDIKINNHLMEYYHNYLCDIADANYSNGEAQ